MQDLKLQKIFRNFAASETKEADGAPRTLVVKISTPTPDRSKDTVQPAGMNSDNFMKNPVVLFAHNYHEMPIAKCTSLKVAPSGILATVEFPSEGTYDKADTIYQMYKEGFLNAWSIGFMPTDYDNNEVGGYDFKTWELFEFSSVPVPDNPEALTIMRGKGINVEAVVGKEGEQPADPTVETPVESSKEGEQPKEDDAKIADMTVGQLKTLITEAVKSAQPVPVKAEDKPTDATTDANTELGLIKRLTNTLKTTDKQVGLTLRLLKTIEAEQRKGGE